MNLVKKFNYIELSRETSESGYRVYKSPDGEELTSVTTILDQTKSEESRKALESWRKGVGVRRSTQVTEEAAFRGTLMHKFLERTILGENPVPGTNIHHKQSAKMAKVIIDNFLKPNLSEAWGLEVNLYYPGLYAGTTDVVGVYAGEPTICDFKQSNKFKTDERVEDYKYQLSAYILAHDKIYGTEIKQGVILMCTVNLEPQCWVIKGDELESYQDKWWNRIRQFYNV